MSDTSLLMATATALPHTIQAVAQGHIQGYKLKCIELFYYKQLGDTYVLPLARKTAAYKLTLLDNSSL